jgi:hypothetical protein
MTRQGLEFVEGSTPSKMEKETTSRGGNGNTEAPTSPERVNARWMNVIRCWTMELFGTNNPKKGAEDAARE